MAFHEVRLPDAVERGAVGGPRFKTSIVVLVSGHEHRNIEWEVTRGIWDIAYGITSKNNTLTSDFPSVIEFFYARQGMAHGFRFKDWSDFELARQNIGTTNGTLATYQTFQRNSSGGVDYDRDLNKLVATTVQVWVDNVSIVEGGGASQFTVNLNTGVITIGSTLSAQSGTAVEVLCEFDVPVRFSSDEIDVTTVLHNAASVNAIPIEEIRV